MSIYLSYHTSTDLSAWRTGSRFSGTNEDAETILSHIASALGYLHKQNIIHNDIKPRNILYDADRGPTLIDFGLATHAGSRPCLGGTAWYVPPELMFDNKRSFESDVFALGITLLFLLRKVELPDLARPNWAIWRVGNGGQGAAKDRSTMVEWLTEVEDLRESLGERKLERVVKDMLVIDPGERILAEDIPNQLQAT